MVWGLRAVAHELDIWRQRALQIPDLPIRRDALTALARKRGNIDGAALFWIIPQIRSHTLLRLLVTYQIMWDYLDSTSETGADSGYENGVQLHLALIEALDASQPMSDYYRFHPWKDDNGYLYSLVESCRYLSAGLRSFERVRPVLVREARRANVQAFNHETDPYVRDAALRRWAEHEYPWPRPALWFELTAAAGAGISIYALFALTVESECTDADIDAVYGAYFPSASALATMLDSYVDQHEDALNEDHIYIRHYASSTLARQGIQRFITRSLQEAGALPNGERHILVIACMIAMYLSKDSALNRDLRPTTRVLLDGAGSLPKLLLPILWFWRSANGQRAC
ncbi:MAG: DUF2600 family protein [Solirubrobacteraceae bacterium]